jgi:hypothetical protein
MTNKRGKRMRSHKTLAEILDDITTAALRRQAQVEHEPIEDETLDLEDILLAQYRAKRWLEEQ